MSMIIFVFFNLQKTMKQHFFQLFMLIFVILALNYPFSKISKLTIGYKTDFYGLVHLIFSIDLNLSQKRFLN
jgi:hypothetical protein